MSVRYNGSSHTATISLAGTQVHTICLWARAASTSSVDANLIQIANATDSDSSRIGFVDVSGTFSAVFVQHRTGAGSTAYLPSISGSAWHHLALVIDGTNQLSYVDGALSDTRAFNASLRTTGMTVVNIGQNFGGATTPDNHVQDAYIFTAALSLAEIQAVMRGRVPRGALANLYAWYPLHGDSLLVDASGKGRTLSTSGGTPAAGTLNPQAVWTGGLRQIMPVRLSAVALSGGTTVASTLAGTLLQSVPLAGAENVASTLAATLSVPKNLAGGSTVASTFSAALSVAVALVGTDTSASTLAATLSQAQPLVGSETVASTLSATLSQAQPLVGSTTSASTLAATLTLPKNLAGDSSVASTLAGDLRVAVALVGAESVASTLAAALDVPKNLAGTESVASTLAATLTQAQPLTGSENVASTLAGALSVPKNLAGSHTVASTLSGILGITGLFEGNSYVASTLSGTLGVLRPIVGSSQVASTLTGSLTQSIGLAGTSSVASTLSATLSTQNYLAGSMASSSTLTGSLSGGTPVYPAVWSGWSDGGDVGTAAAHGAWIENPTGGAEAPHGAWFASVDGSSATQHGRWTEDPVPGGVELHPELHRDLIGGARTASTLTAALTNTVLQPALYGTAITGAEFAIQKNWVFGTNGNIPNAAALNAEFTYHDPFGTISNGTNYGALMVRAPGADAFGVYNWADIGMANDQQPVDPGTRYRSFTADSMLCHVKPLNTGSTVVGPPNAYNAGCGSFVSKLTLEAGGARLGRDLVWETRCRILNAPNGYWFALWLVGPSWDGGPEIDVVEAFSSSSPNVNGDLFNSNGIGLGPNTYDYFSGGWDTVLSTLGLPGYALPDGAQSLRNWHTFTLEYKADDTFRCFMDGTVIQSGTLDWRLPSGPSVPSLSFLFDFGFGHTQISPIDSTVISDINATPLTYEIAYSRIWLR